MRHLCFKSLGQIQKLYLNKFSVLVQTHSNSTLTAGRSGKWGQWEGPQPHSWCACTLMRQGKIKWRVHWTSAGFIVNMSIYVSTPTVKSAFGHSVLFWIITLWITFRIGLLSVFCRGMHIMLRQQVCLSWTSRVQFCAKFILITKKLHFWSFKKILHFIFFLYISLWDI